MGFNHAGEKSYRYKKYRAAESFAYDKCIFRHFFSQSACFGRIAAREECLVSAQKWQYNAASSFATPTLCTYLWRIFSVWKTWFKNKRP